MITIKQKCDIENIQGKLHTFNGIINIRPEELWHENVIWLIQIWIHCISYKMNIKLVTSGIHLDLILYKAPFNFLCLG